MTEKKISIKHFENHRLAPSIVQGKSLRPLYFRMTYERKQTEMRTSCYDSLLKNKILSKEDLLKLAIRIDLCVIEGIIERLKKAEKFSLQNFKADYKLYSQNVVEIIDSEALRLAENFLKKHNLRLLLEHTKKEKLNSERILKYLEEFNATFTDLLKLEEPFPIYSLFHDHTNSIIEFKNEIAKSLKLSSLYISLQDWLAGTDIINEQIEDVALNASSNHRTGKTDIERMNYLKEFYSELSAKIIKMSCN